MLLRGAAGIAVGLPLLDAMQARAQVAQVRRFILSYMGTCTGGAALTNPATTGPFSAPLPASFAALQAVSQHISIISGLRFPTHSSGATPTQPGSAVAIQHGGTVSAAVSGVSGEDGRAPQVRGHSADQVAADLLGTGLRIPSLQLRVQAASYNNLTGTSSQRRSTSVRKSGTVLSELLPNESPLRLYNQLFNVRPFNGGGGGPLSLLEKRKSVLDAVLGDAARLSGSVGAEDRQRLDQHFTHIRELEQSIVVGGGSGSTGGGSGATGGGVGSTGGGSGATGGGAGSTGGGSGATGGGAGSTGGGAGSTGGGSGAMGGGSGSSGGGTGTTTGPGGACVGLNNPGADPAVNYGFGSWSQETTRGHQMADMITYALACDMTRAVAWMFTHDQCWLSSTHTSGSTLLGNGNLPEIHNDSHFATTAIKAANANWGAGLFGRLVANLAARSEGAGTLLDNTFLSMVFAEGLSAHNKTDLTYVVAGLPSRIRNGVHVASNGAHPAQVQVSGLTALGLTTNRLGEVTGTIPGLMV